MIKNCKNLIKVNVIEMVKKWSHLYLYTNSYLYSSYWKNIKQGRTKKGVQINLKSKKKTYSKAPVYVSMKLLILKDVYILSILKLPNFQNK